MSNRKSLQLSNYLLINLKKIVFLCIIHEFYGKIARWYRVKSKYNMFYFLTSIPRNKLKCDIVWNTYKIFETLKGLAQV